MGHHLRVRIAFKLEALSLKLFPQLGVVFNDTVMDDGDLLIVAHMGMGIDIRRLPVGGPTGVANPGAAGEGGAVLGFLHQVLDPAAGLHHVDAFLSQHGNAGGVVPSIFQFFQPIQQDGGCVLIAGKSDDSTHRCFLLLPVCRAHIGPRTGLRAGCRSGASSPLGKHLPHCPGPGGSGPCPAFLRSPCPTAGKCQGRSHPPGRWYHPPNGRTPA